jgi:sphinganine-1-phosphate aldolase
MIPADSNLRLTPESVAQAIDQDTILVYTSYPSYAYGSCEDVEAIAGVCKGRGVEVHLDMCLGGFSAPFVEGVKRPVPVPRGVSSVSIDPHKYGMSGKGASVLLFKS